MEVAAAAMEVVVNATRESDNEPLIVSVWIPGMQTGEDEQAIKFKAVVFEGASDNDPFGHFTFNFDFTITWTAQHRLVVVK